MFVFNEIEFFLTIVTWSQQRYWVRLESQFNSHLEFTNIQFVSLPRYYLCQFQAKWKKFESAKMCKPNFEHLSKIHADDIELRKRKQCG